MSRSHGRAGIWGMQAWRQGEFTALFCDVAKKGRVKGLVLGLAMEGPQPEMPLLFITVDTLRSKKPTITLMIWFLLMR